MASNSKIAKTAKPSKAAKPSTNESTVYAAGAVCWREVSGEIKILIIHRPHHKDISLPKGKVDPGEVPPQTAVREIREETGLSVHLGAPLGTSEYEMPGGRGKVVYYWAAEARGRGSALKDFVPNSEVSRVQWVSVSKAMKKLSYPHDAEVVARFAERVERGQARTFALITLRHAKTVPGEHWDGPDHSRPLLHAGRERAAEIAPALMSWGVKKILSSTAVRCRETVNPLAAQSGIDVLTKKGLSQDAWDAGADTVAQIIAKRLEKRASAVLCSHAPVLPEILEQAARLSGSPISKELQKASGLGPGDFAVLHLNTAPEHPGIVAVERYQGTAL